MSRWMIGLLLGSLPALAWGDTICVDAKGALVEYTHVARTAAGCTPVPDAAVTAQRALWNAVGDRKYLKVQGGLLTVMTSEEKAQVDQAQTTLDAERQRARHELASNDLCTTTDLTTLEPTLQKVVKLLCAKHTLGR